MGLVVMHLPKLRGSLFRPTSSASLPTLNRRRCSADRYLGEMPTLKRVKYASRMRPLAAVRTILGRRMMMTGASEVSPSRPLDMRDVRLAVLHQGAPAPAVGGVVKPAKPNGYTDSASDIAHALSPFCTVLTPTASPSPASDAGWSFPDTSSGILAALEAGANVLYANTVLHSTHPLTEPSVRSRLAEAAKNIGSEVRLVGQNIHDTQRVDDKAAINTWLSGQKGLESWFPRAVTVGSVSELRGKGWNEGGVAKPIRGRGSHGVKMCKTMEELERHVEVLLKESDKVLVEEILSGEEATVAVLPPGTYSGIGAIPHHLALNPVSRFNHQDGIAPYSGSVPVSVNSASFPLLSSRSIPVPNSRPGPSSASASSSHPGSASPSTRPTATQSQDPAEWRFPDLRKACEEVARHCQTVAVMRIDCRRRAGAADNRRQASESAEAGEEHKGEWVLFDVNMKPNITGPGRPGREAQTSLVGLAAETAGWDYPTLLQNLVCNSQPVSVVLEEGRLQFPLSS